MLNNPQLAYFVGAVLGCIVGAFIGYNAACYRHGIGEEE